VLIAEPDAAAISEDRSLVENEVRHVLFEREDILLLDPSAAVPEVAVMIEAAGFELGGGSRVLGDDRVLDRVEVGALLVPIGGIALEDITNRGSVLGQVVGAAADEGAARV